jgi:DNA (cytosine-5)-methyltransferase 1
MKVLDLFSGIGGFSLGLKWSGMQTVAFCEKDKFCRQVLSKNWPNIKIHEDIRTLDGNQYRGSIDVVCGGFPCQPFSVAGKQQGEKDDRHLWPEMLRVIKESKPSWVIGENVSGFVKMALNNVCSDLETEGYRVQSFIIPACAVNAPHKRDRCWVVAYSNSNDRRDSSCSFSSDRQTRMEYRSSSNRQPVSKPSKDMAYYDNIQPRSNQWETEPRVGRVANGIPDRVDRIRSLGNAVVPQVVEQIGLHIANFHKGE